MDQLISRETLDMLSYRSTLGQRLKQISLRETPLGLISDSNGTGLFKPIKEFGGEINGR